MLRPVPEVEVSSTNIRKVISAECSAALLPYFQAHHTCFYIEKNGKSAEQGFLIYI